MWEVVEHLKAHSQPHVSVGPQETHPQTERGREGEEGGGRWEKRLYLDTAVYWHLYIRVLVLNACNDIKLRSENMGCCTVADMSMLLYNKVRNTETIKLTLQRNCTFYTFYVHACIYANICSAM